MPRRKKGSEAAPVERITISLLPDLDVFVENAWRHHVKLDGTLANNVSQYIADLIARDRRKKT